MKEEKLHNQIAAYLRNQYPKVIFQSDASGVKMPIGLATKFAKLKSGRGIPDLFIAEPRNGYHGLYIELKVESPYKLDGGLKKNEHLQEQSEILKRLNYKGYKAVFGVGFDETKNIIDDYLKVSIDEKELIIKNCVKLFNTTIDRCKSKSRKAEDLFSRQLSQYIIKKRYDSISLTETGKIFSTDHATVINAIKQIDRLIEGNSFTTIRGVKFDVVETKKLIKKWLG